MAVRPVFIPDIESKNKLVKIININFNWVTGIAISQQQKNIDSFHNSIKEELNLKNILEISTKSNNKLGVKLSAFNLMIDLKKMKINSDSGKISVESAFQGSKVFKSGGPYWDIYEKSSKEAKKDLRIKESEVMKFNFFGNIWPNKPFTLFYDWLYINALYQNFDIAKNLFKYEAFTDIAFNPKKSINCQAYSAALYVSLYERKILDKVIESEKYYKDIINKYKNVLYESTIKLNKKKKEKTLFL